MDYAYDYLDVNLDVKSLIMITYDYTIIVIIFQNPIMIKICPMFLVKMKDCIIIEIPVFSVGHSRTGKV